MTTHQKVTNEMSIVKTVKLSDCNAKLSVTVVYFKRVDFRGLRHIRIFVSFFFIPPHSSHFRRGCLAALFFRLTLRRPHVTMKAKGEVS